MNALDALSRIETLNDRLSTLNLAGKLFEEKGRGTGVLVEIHRELEMERNEIMDKLRAVKI